MFQVARQIVRFRPLLRTLTARELKARYRGSVLGSLWSLANPLLLLAVYTFVFSVVFKPRVAGADPYALFVVAGLFPWIWLSTSLLEGGALARRERRPDPQGGLPRRALTMVSVLSNLAHLLLAMPILAVALATGRLRAVRVPSLPGSRETGVADGNKEGAERGRRMRSPGEGQERPEVGAPSRLRRAWPVWDTVTPMRSEYDPIFPGPAEDEADDLEPVRDLFHAASRPFLRSPGSWLAWAVVLPAVALATPAAFARGGPAGVLLAWSAAILLAGAVEVAAIRRSGPGGAGRIAGWVLRGQGNLSLVALALSFLLIWTDAAWALPGVWLLLLGHSFYQLGGLAFDPFRAYGLIYQAGGIAALWPGGHPLLAFALTAAAGNLWMAWQVWRATRSGGP